MNTFAKLRSMIFREGKDQELQSKDQEQESYEVPSEVYFNEKLRPEDAEHLKRFLFEFIEVYKEFNMPSTILAVGSSTFPEEHWNNRREI